MKLLCTAVIIFPAILVFGQSKLQYLSLETKTDNSSLIVEGRVVHQSSFYSEDGHISTKNTIQIHKIFKGSPELEFVDVITHGGTIKDVQETSSHTLRLGGSDYGMFFLMEINQQNDLTSNFQFEVFGNFEGVVKYRQEMEGTLAYAPGTEIWDIPNEFYAPIVAITGSNPKELKATPFLFK
jgi:hypothetical protein